MIVSSGCFNDRTNSLESVRPFGVIRRAKESDRTAIGLNQLGNHFDKRCLTSSIFPNQTVNFSLFHGETDVIQSELLSKSLADVFHIYNSFHNMTSIFSIVEFSLFSLFSIQNACQISLKQFSNISKI